MSKVSYQNFINVMKDCKATIICCDEYYNDHFFTLRMFESILADNIVFIDKQMDTEKEFYSKLGSDLYIDWLYIENTDWLSPDIDYYVLWREIKQRVLDFYDEASERTTLVQVLEKCVNIG